MPSLDPPMLYQIILVFSKCIFLWFLDDVTVKIIDRLCVVDAKSPPYYVRNNVKGTTCKVPRKELVVYDTSMGQFTQRVT